MCANHHDGRWIKTATALVEMANGMADEQPPGEPSGIAGTDAGRESRVTSSG